MRSDADQPLTYAEFRIGGKELYAETALELRLESWRQFETTGVRMFISRSTILGRMRQKKLASYEAYRRAYARKKVPESLQEKAKHRCSSLARGLQR